MSTETAPPLPTPSPPPRTSSLAIAGIITGAAGIVTGIFVVAVLAGMLLPALNVARERAREAACINNVRQLALACIQYSEQHEKVLPRTLDQVNQYLSTPASGKATSPLVCPSAKNSNTPSYRIVGGGTVISAKPGSTVLIEETERFHRGVRVVGYQDGNVEAARNESYRLNQ